MANRSYIARHPVFTVFLTFLVLLLAVAGYAFYRLKSDQGAWLKPDLQSMQLNVQEITPDSLKARVTMTVRNNLPVSVRIDSLGYVVSLDGQPLIQGSQHEPTALRASANGQLTMPMHTDFRKLAKKITQLQRDSADVHVRMTMYSHFPVVGSQRVPVEIDRTVYIPKLPKVEVDKVKVDKLGLKGGQLITTLKITNYNSAPFTIQNFTYHFRLSDNVDVKGVEKKDLHFQKAGTQTVDIPVTLDFSKIGEAVYEMLFKSESTPYQMSGTMAVSTPKNLLGNFNLNFNSHGTVKDLKEIVKKPDRDKQQEKEEKEEQREKKKEARKQEKEEKKEAKQRAKDEKRAEAKKEERS